ncbi:MAG: hypothetical protein IKI24_02005 [Clostridia bacterium]|jgi:hypothetical protein|nr:hypothetical protein [Clostridia bacterium]MCR4576490.1 hypothetical protein [Clostridiales bacterium]
MRFNWIDGYTLRVSVNENEVTVSANREGLLSLANHLITLAGSPSKDHFHLDESNSLEDGSAELIVEKTD